MKKLLVSALILMSFSIKAQQNKKSVIDSSKVSNVFKLPKIDTTAFVNEQDFTDALNLIQKTYADKFTLQRYYETIEVYNLLKQVALARKQKK